MIRLIHSALVAVLLTPVARAEEPKWPNIVVILADDLGYGDVQRLNPDRGKVKTPHIDKLASQGMTFTDAHSGSSVCAPNAVRAPDRPLRLAHPPPERGY